MFADRAAAGRALARLLDDHAGRRDLVVIGLPRGGVVVASEVAHALDAPLDVCVVRKLGVPGHEELAFGAIAGHAYVRNEEVVHSLRLSPEDIDGVVRREQAELARRERAYRGNSPAAELTGKTVIVVDDGLATGATMCAAVDAVRSAGAVRTVVAVPVGAEGACARLRERADAVVCAEVPAAFFAVGQWYADFRQTTDAEVTGLLALRR